MTFLAPIVYILCALTSITCTVLLLRSFSRTKAPLLFWSGLCFLGLAIDNSLMFYDLMIIPQFDISTFRNSISLLGVSCLIYGLVMEMGTSR
jgi:hypothetical protein